MPEIPQSPLTEPQLPPALRAMVRAAPDRRAIIRMMLGGAGTTLAASAVLGTRAAEAQSLGIPAYVDVAQTFTAIQTFSQPTLHSELTATASKPTATPLTVRLAASHVADALRVVDSAGSTLAGLSAMGDLTVKSVVAKSPVWDGTFKPPFTFESDKTLGWMPHPAPIRAFSWVQGGKEAIRLSHDGAVTQMQTFATNRFMLISNSAIVFYSATGHIEWEAPANLEMTITSYQVGSPIGKTVVFVTDPQYPATPLAVQGSGNVNIQDWRDGTGQVQLSVDSRGRLKFSASMQSTSATSGAAQLPQNPAGFMSIVDAYGVERKVPYYAK